ILAALHLPSEGGAGHVPEPMAKMMSERREPEFPKVAMQNLMRVWQAGITVGMGTDAGNIGTVHGPAGFREMELMQRAGLTPLQVLKSATVNGAATMGIARLGTVAKGQLADLVLLEADPTKDVGNLSHAVAVFKDGQQFSPLELMSAVR